MFKLIDELQLFRGQDYVINEHITIHQPTLNEICDFGELRYYNMVYILTSTPSQYKVQLFDMGIDYEEISDFDLFVLLCRHLTVEDTSILFGNLDFSKCELMFNENKEPVLVDFENDTLIDNIIYILMVEYLRSVHFIEKQVDKAGNAHTKQYLIDRERRQLGRKSKKQQKSVLIPLISAMTNCEQFKYNHDDVWNLHIYVFNDSVRRIQKIKNYDQIMQGAYSGCVDLKKIELESISWLGNLD